MAIKYKIYQSEYPYHVYNRVNNKEHLFALENAFPLFIRALQESSKKYAVLPHHFVLLENHYHLMVSTPKCNLALFMKSLNTKVSLKLNKSLGRVNHFFGGRYGATVVQDESYIYRLIKYIYQNPVRANLSKTPWNYPYSSIKFYLEGKAQKNGFFWDPCLDGIMHDKKKIETLYDLCSIDLDAYEFKLIDESLKYKNLEL